jgi:hypothetical protein
MIAAALPLLLEVLAAVSFLAAPCLVGALAALPLHGAAAATASRYFARQIGCPEPESWRQLAFPFLVACFCPPVGVPFLCFYDPLLRQLKARGPREAEYEVFDRAALTEYRPRHRYARDTAALPLVEIIKKGALDAQLQAVLATRKARLNPRVTTKLLREALGTGVHELEVIASTSLAEIEEGIDASLGRLMKEAKEAGLPADYNAVARQFHEYGYMGLAEGALQEYYLESAIRCFQRSLEIDPNQPTVRVELVRYYLEAGRLDEALEQFEEAAVGGYSSPKGYFYLAEIYYRQRRWRDVVKICTWLNGQKVPEIRLQEICAFWSEACEPTSA